MAGLLSDFELAYPNAAAPGVTPAGSNLLSVPPAGPGAVATPAESAVGPLSKASRFLRFGAKALGGTAASLALGGMGAGMADQAAATTSGATPENRLSRALQILSGADITGVGARIGRFLTGTPEPTAPNPIIGPAIAPQVAAAGGPNAYVKNLQPRLGAVPVVATSAATPTAPGGDMTDSDRAFQLLQSTDKLVGSAGTGDTADINARIRGFGANPQALGNLNEAMRLDRTGVQATRDENGQITFSSAPGAQTQQYQTPDGKLTADYTKSAQYLGGVQRAQADAARLAELTNERDLNDAAANVRNATTVNGQRTALAVLAAKLQLQSTREKTAATAGTERSKLLQELFLKAPGAQKEASEAAIKNATLETASKIKDPIARAAALGNRLGATPKVSVPTAQLPDPAHPGQLQVLKGDKLVWMKAEEAPQTITLADAVASAKKNNKYQSDAQVRRDVEKLGYKVTD